MKLFVISPAHFFKGEAALINQLFEAGMPVLHLRKENPNPRQYAGLISAVDERYHHRIALHQFHELTTEFPAIKRLHYPERMRNKLTQPFKNKEFTRSTSIHNLNDLNGVQGFAYTFYGPVFDSLSKPGYQTRLAGDFKVPVQENTAQLIALGGVDGDKIESLKQMGFKGAAVLGALWNDKEQALANFDKIKTACSS
ncbi:thiamine phosphate synthase [Pedobacter africanus]|uniref:Thiamine-phosphate pyrophosphorylase n=1 Tax=Pedobacter africanus TaxID=151894 RepID=A0A1W2CM15_9SPHI|nr:thiamine phosphate synthase [Pedobacter africanus]SMC86253.1 thiamine-phosphate pyrophosphorylase [Pedobacter africanus]